MWLAIPGAVGIGLSLGLMGSGGSILTVPVLLYLFGQDEKVAIAGSLLVVGVTAMSASLAHVRKKRVDWRVVLWFGVPGMLGTYLGAMSSAHINGEVQLLLFAIIMLIAAWQMLRNAQIQQSGAVDRNVVKIIVDGLIVGVITGLVGVGGGFLIVPALVLLGGVPVHRAVATSLVIIALKSFSGFVKYLDVLKAAGLSLDWSVLGLVCLASVTGSFFGGLMADQLDQARMKRFFAVFLLIMALFIAVRTVPNFIA